MSKIKKTKIAKIIFIGGNRFNEDGPFLGFASECHKKNIDFTLLVDSQRINYPTKTMGVFRDALIKNSISFEIIDSIKESIISKHLSENTIIFSVHCRWIIPEEIIKIMPHKIFNYHNLSLPGQRGAAGHSWRLMQGIKETELNIHYVTPELDRGNIILRKKIKFPKSYTNLEKCYDYISKYEQILFKDFLSNKSWLNIKQRESESFYWPRLDTNKNGYIDWNWSAQDIMHFCNAFDKPFDGASTYINNKRVFVINTQIADNNITFHPYQSGLIYRIDNDYIYTATIKGGLKFKLNKNKSKNIKIRLGDRFITPLDKLYSAKIDKSKY